MTDEQKIPDQPENVSRSELAQLQERLLQLEERVDAGELTQEAELRAVQIKEAKQRVGNRTIAIWVCIVLLIFMAVLIVCTYKKIISGEFGVALVLAPVASITTITVALLFGAFRRFKDDDATGMRDLAVEVIKAGTNSGGS